MTMRLLAAAAAAALAAAPLAVPAAAQTRTTLDQVKERGLLLCGGHTGAPGFSLPDSQGNWTGFDVEICRAVAAAVLGDANKVRLTPLTSQQRLTALQSGTIDLLVRTTTWTHSRDTNLGLTFAGVNFYDGQGFLVRAGLNLRGAKELDGASICVTTGTTNELNLADWARTNRLTVRPVVFEQNEETRKAYIAGRCDAFTTDASQLAGIRTAMEKPDDHVILPDIISKEPLGPLVRKGDPQWFDIVRWTLFALIEAEELGVTRANVDQMLESQNPAVQRLLGRTGGHGRMMGLDDAWAYRIVKQLGNYGELFERNLGQQSPLKLPRGPNDLWTRGGLMYAMPIR
jgi:general L-amino acid transport system substrate-binding protein